MQSTRTLKSAAARIAVRPSPVAPPHGLPVQQGRRCATAHVSTFQSASTVSVTEAASEALRNNSAFQAVFAEVLARNGSMETLTSSHEEEMKKTNLEMVLEAALNTSKVSYQSSVSVQMELERVFEREKKQFERLQFTLQKCKSDQAYYSSLQSVLDKGVSKPPGYEAPYISAAEELMITSIETSRKTLASLTAMLDETNKALMRERSQIERLEFAVKKCTADEAYYKSLRMMLEEGSE